MIFSLFKTFTLLLIVSLCYAGRYLNYERLKETSKSHPGPVKVRCFNRGIWYVCPDPRDHGTVADIQKQYDHGMYISHQDFMVSKDYLENKKNWNA